MGKIKKSIEMEASPEKVFTYMISESMNEAWKEWVTAKWTSDGPTGVGSTAHFVGAGTTGEWDMDVTEFVKNKKMAMRTIGASKIKMTSSITLEPTAKGTTVTYSVDYKLPYSVLGKLLDKLKVSKDMEKQNTKMLENTKKALEA